MNRKIPILTYHQVAPNPEACYPLQSVEPKTFALQMKLLSKLGYNTIDLDQLYEYRNGNGNLPKKPIVITFDDGYQDSIDYSIPILKDYGFTAIYYIPTDYVGRNSSWLMPELGFELPIVDWKRIKWLDSNGFHIGDHSASHPHLDQITRDECIKELKVSKNTLEEKLGHDVKHLAYPYGSYNKSVMSVAAELGFKTGCTIEEGLCKSKYDRLSLPRINIGQRDSIVDFVSKIHTGFSPQSGAKILFNKTLNNFSTL